MLRTNWNLEVGTCSRRNTWGKKHSEQVNISFDLITSDWLKKIARNWTPAALNGISYNNHSSRLTFPTILHHRMDIVSLCSSSGVGCLMFFLKWWPKETKNQSSLLCKVTNKPSICRALLLKKSVVADSVKGFEENAMHRAIACSGPMFSSSSLAVSAISRCHQEINRLCLGIYPGVLG